MLFRLILILTLASVCGCGSEAHEEPSKNSNEGTVKNDAAAKLKVSATPQSVDESRRVHVGALSFIPPKDWDKSKSELSQKSFLPHDDPKWRQIGLRPVIGGSKRANPGVSFERLKSVMEDLLKKSASDMNEGFRKHPDPLGPSPDKLPTMESNLKSSIISGEIGGTRVIEMVCYATFSMDSKSLATKTTSITFVAGDGIYTFSLMSPIVSEKEMDQVWMSVKQSIRIAQ